jgi:hypothetical protein
MKPIKIMVLGQTAVGKSGECIEWLFDDEPEYVKF